MSRSVQINYARFLSTPTTSFDPVSQTGLISAQYVVGVSTGTAPNFSFKDHPTCNNMPAASVALSATDTAGAKLTQLVGTIMAQEGLTQGTDHVFDSNGTVLV